jgi:GNAT superfamily N-acetyltransferase
MQSVFQLNKNYSVKQLSLDNWHEYRDFYKNLSKPRHFSYIFLKNSPDEYSTYKKLAESISEDRGIMFAVWENNKIVGQACLYFKDQDDPTVIFTALEIADTHRGKGIRCTKMLYDTCLDYLKNTQFKGSLIVNRHLGEEIPNIMERIGFTKTEENTKFTNYKMEIK